ncbi:FecR domain-containing protein [Neorhizobium galegae]|uniref:FecR family protein n=1 Tax=Neorhizobium galegae TaxID=399 RepID=UPI000622AC9B|nr:FecR domain-containing protein [Neorhizobium galegae]MCM2498892.1 FecR domain-containing protein [Neorhizobium galegae]CDZ27885.1 Anti-FecI sigma factor, FecR [Neorhizobium galegae bv. officinalis]
MREQAVDWLLRLQEHPEDLDAQSDFELWLAGDPARAVVYERARRAVGDATHLLSSDLEFAGKAARGPMTGRRNVVMAITLLVCSSTAFYLADGPVRLQADVISGVAKTQRLTLADGSRIELNADSAIAFRLEKDRRQVQLLRGQAYFQVAADQSRPFTVVAGNGATTALGTAFDVNLTSDGARVVVTEHAVMVGPEGSPETRWVTERQKIDYDANGRPAEPEPADPDIATAWRRGRLAFDNRRLAAVIEEFARYIPGKVVVAQTSLANRHISGSLDLTAPQTALDGFANAFGIRITRLGSYLTVLSE